jgi:hypothetical protein
MRLTAVLISMLLLTFTTPVDAKGKRKHWCRVGKTPKTHNCNYLGSGSGG